MQFHKEVGQHRKRFYRINILRDTEKDVGCQLKHCLFVWFCQDHGPRLNILLGKWVKEVSLVYNEKFNLQHKGCGLADAKV